MTDSEYQSAQNNMVVAVQFDVIGSASTSRMASRPIPFDFVLHAVTIVATVPAPGFRARLLTGYEDISGTTSNGDHQVIYSPYSNSIGARDGQLNLVTGQIELHNLDIFYPSFGRRVAVELQVTAPTTEGITFLFHIERVEPESEL